MKICIDAGHNFMGFDTGAMENGVQEQVVTYKIADALKDYLHSVGVKTFMTRPLLEANVGYNLQSSLENRAKLANENECDLFVSIHCNSNVNKTANGTETLISARGGEAEKLAAAVQKSIVKHLKTADRGVRVDNEYLGYNLAVLEKTKMPAILIETAFVSNTKDAELLKKRYGDFAKSIFWGVCEYLGIDTQTNPKEEIKELETVNDIVWELAHKGIITDKELWLEKLKTDTNAYWLARKCVNYIRGIE